MKIFIPLTRSPEKIDFYRKLLKNVGVLLIPAEAFVDRTATPKELDHTRAKNILGKTEEMKAVAQGLADNEAGFFAMLFYHLGYVQDGKSLKDVETALEAHINNKNNDQFSFDFIREEYRSAADDLFQHPEEIVFAVDDSKLSIVDVRFSTIYEMAEKEKKRVSQEQKNPAQALVKIIDESCAVIAKKAWDKHIAENSGTNENKEAFIAQKKQSLLDAIKNDDKEFPGAMASTFYEVAGGIPAFYTLVFEALGKNQKALLPIESASTINAVRLKRTDGKLIVEEVFTVDGSPVLRGKSKTPAFLRHPDTARALYPNEPVTLLTCVVLPDKETTLIEANPTQLSQYGGRREACKKGGLLKKNTSCIPIHQAQIPVAVIFSTAEQLKNANNHPVVQQLQKQGHQVTRYTAGGLLPELESQGIFDPSQFGHDHGEAFYQAVTGNGVFVLLPEEQAQDNLDMDTLELALIINTMIGKANADTGKRIIRVGDETPIHEAIKRTQEICLTSSPLLSSCRTPLEGFAETFENVIQESFIRLGASPIVRYPNHGRLPNQESSSLCEEQFIILSFCGSAICQEPETLAFSEKKMRGILDAAITQARAENKKIIVVHGAGHEGLMGIFDRVASEYQEKNRDLIAVLGATTPELLETEAEGKPPTRGILYNILYLQRLGIVTGALNMCVGPGGLGTLHEVLEVLRLGEIIENEGINIHIDLSLFKDDDPLKPLFAAICEMFNQPVATEQAFVPQSVAQDVLLALFTSARAVNGS
jgi:predicted Rossmann-fold nucleotide-binding protein/cell division protein FtsB